MAKRATFKRVFLWKLGIFRAMFNHFQSFSIIFRHPHVNSTNRLTSPTCRPTAATPWTPPQLAAAWPPAGAWPQARGRRAAVAWPEFEASHTSVAPARARKHPKNARNRTANASKRHAKQGCCMPEAGASLRRKESRSWAFCSTSKVHYFDMLSIDHM